MAVITNVGPSNAVDVDILRIGTPSTGRFRTDLPMVALWVADEILDADDDDLDAEWEEIA